ncbi:hypothetical protein M427DRAFT_278250 [Gonapodya prolifera JEL478]|uniref:Uncharacterized protein n=1 Tax=Gonapodya prolifera (strain JEL478) TaxID=1344416 RepID=A0A139AYG3_GONPJ|nr:hypothetical protein M427DRAFT_278250 [Gonapodya prolifera JEL478]|eukprot:KXS21766.1 hypothetical protein M427DRAFT_278250 [Gonapodya prolifera JEL478]
MVVLRELGPLACPTNGVLAQAAHAESTPCRAWNECLQMRHTLPSVPGEVGDLLVRQVECRKGELWSVQNHRPFQRPSPFASLAKSSNMDERSRKLEIMRYEAETRLLAAKAESLELDNMEKRLRLTREGSLPPIGGAPLGKRSTLFPEGRSRARKESSSSSDGFEMLPSPPVLPRHSTAGSHTRQTGAPESSSRKVKRVTRVEIEESSEDEVLPSSKRKPRSNQREPKRAVVDSDVEETKETSRKRGHDGTGDERSHKITRVSPPPPPSTPLEECPVPLNERLPWFRIFEERFSSNAETARQYHSIRESQRNTFNNLVKKFLQEKYGDFESFLVKGHGGGYTVPIRDATLLEKVFIAKIPDWPPLPSGSKASSPPSKSSHNRAQPGRSKERSHPPEDGHAAVNEEGIIFWKEGMLQKYGEQKWRRFEVKTSHREHTQQTTCLSTFLREKYGDTYQKYKRMGRWFIPKADIDDLAMAFATTQRRWIDDVSSESENESDGDDSNDQRSPPRRTARPEEAGEPTEGHRDGASPSTVPSTTPNLTNAVTVVDIKPTIKDDDTELIIKEEPAPIRG